MIARSKGASVGSDSSMPLKLALKANSNLIIGKDSIIESHLIDLRQKVVIGKNVIINKGATIIRQSHNINSLEFETIGSDLIIEDYTWLTTNTLIVPSCKLIRKGTVLAAGSVLTRDTNAGDVLGGNPAQIIGQRKVLPTQLLPSALQGRDFISYIKARFH